MDIEKDASPATKTPRPPAGEQGSGLSRPAIPLAARTWQLPLLAILGVVIVMTIVGLAVYLSARQSITERAHENLAAISQLKVGQIEHWLSERRDDALFVTRSSIFSRNLQRWMAGGMRDEALKENLLHHLHDVSAIPHYHVINLHSASDGALLLSSAGRHADMAHAASQARQAASQGTPLLDDLHFVNDDKTPAIELGYFIPISQGDGPPLAVVHLITDPTKLLFPLLQQLPSSSPSAETLLIRTEGDELLYLNTLRHRANTALKFRMPRAMPGLLAAQAANGKTGAIRGIDYRDIPSLGHALPVAGTPWRMIAKIDEAEIYAQLNRLALFSAVVTALSLLAGIGWLVIHRRSSGRIERLSRLYAAISQTNQAIIHSRTPAEVYRAVCHACVELAGLRLAWIGMADPLSQQLRPIESAGPAAAYLKDILISTRPELAEGQGPAGTAFREGRPCESSNFQGDPGTMPWQARAAEYGLGSLIALPLLRTGQVVGTLCVYGGEKNFFDAEAHHILGEMANNISFFLDHFDQEAERRQLTEKMDRYVAEIEDLYQNAPCGYHSLDGDGMIVRINDTELRWLGYARHEVIGRLHANALLTPASRQRFAANFSRFKASGELSNLRMEMVRKDGSILPVNLTASAVRDAAGRYLYSRTTVFDMTEIHRLEEERAAHENHLRILSRRLVAVQEEERRQLVSELHDSTSPNLAAIQVILNTMKPRLASMPAAVDLHDWLQDALALLEDTGQNVREICGELRPSLLDYAGLVAALAGYARQFSRRTGITVDFTGDESAPRLSTESESTLFRIAQEALTNCAKHAQASHIAMQLVHGTGDVALVIRDNGSGFNPENLGAPGRQPGLGLITMRERAEFIGGTFTLASQPGRGTTITVRLGLPAAASGSTTETCAAVPANGE